MDMMQIIVARRRLLLKRPVEIEFIANTLSTADQSTYTFNGQGFGDAAENRHIVVAATGRLGSTQSINSVTIGGVGATAAVNLTSGLPAGIFVASVPSGTSGSVVVNFSTTMGWAAISVYRMIGAAGVTPHDSIDITGGSSGGHSDSIAVPKGGVAVGLVLCNASGSITWTGLDEDFDTNAEGSYAVSAAHEAFANRQPSLTVSAQKSPATSNATLVAASFGP